MSDPENAAGLPEPVVPRNRRDIRAGLYRHKRNGKFYLLDKLIRLHTDGTHWVTYIPLWIDPKYTGPRTSARPVDDFFNNFDYYGPSYEGHPEGNP